MKAITCPAYGPADTLELRDAPPPEPGPGEVRVAVHACGLNFADTLMIRGQYQEKPVPPFTPGLEVSGVIDAVGDGVDGDRVGARVAAACGRGGLAEAVCCEATAALPIPDAMSFEVAAGFAVAYGTAHMALAHRAQLQPGETLLVHGAGGGVGRAAVDVGKALGARVIATASSDEKRALATAAGADLTIDYRDGFRDAVKAATDGRGVDVVFDPVGGAVFSESVRCLAWCARLVVVGFASGDIAQFPTNLALVKNIAITGVYWGAYARNDPATLRDSMGALMALYSQGKLSPEQITTCPLAEAPDALAALAGRKAVGKLVVSTR